MKHLHLIFIITMVAVYFNTASQQLLAQAPCEVPNAQADLDINNVRATILSSNNLWRNYETGGAGYEIPKDSSTHSIFEGAVWMGG